MKGLAKKSFFGLIVGMAVLGCGMAFAQGMVVDVKPGSCTNPVNTRSRGVLPVAIVGLTESALTVADIDPVTVHIVGVINDDGSDLLFVNPVPAIRSALEDVGSPEDCEAGPDGIDDLILKFKTQDLVSALKTDAADLVTNNNQVTLIFEATLNDGTEAGIDIQIQGTDDILLKVKKQKK